MKTYCELYFTGNRTSLEKFITEIQSYAHGEWNASIEQKMGTPWIAFNYHGNAVDRASVCISLHNLDSTNELHVTNIVPLEKQKLNIDEYNNVLREFYKDIVLPYKTTHHDINISQVTDDIFDPKSIISEEALEKLTLFCNAANKSTGSSHPCDQERWYDFICQTVDDDKIFDFTTLAQFLQDEDYWGKKDPDYLGVMGHFAWDKDSAEELASEYESACSILQYYKRTRGV